MPGGDRTGPMGMGPMTGRAAGFCAGYPVPGYMNPMSGRGFGRGFGRGRGRGWRHRYWAAGFPGWAGGGWASPWGFYPPSSYAVPNAPTVTREQELEALKAQADQYQRTLGEIQKRIEELESISE